MFKSIPQLPKPAFCVPHHWYVHCLTSSAEYNKAIRNYTRFDDWYLWVQMYKGTVSMPVFQSLEAYWPGLQVGAIRESGLFLWNGQSKLILLCNQKRLSTFYWRGGLGREEKLRVSQTDLKVLPHWVFQGELSGVRNWTPSWLWNVVPFKVHSVFSGLGGHSHWQWPFLHRTFLSHVLILDSWPKMGVNASGATLQPSLCFPITWSWQHCSGKGS